MIPDFRQLMQKASPEDLRELLSAFDLGVVYDKELRVLRLSAVLTDNSSSKSKSSTTNVNRWGTSFIAGARYEGVPTTSCRIEEVRSCSESARRKRSVATSSASSSERTLAQAMLFSLGGSRVRRWRCLA
jgi:hypothetical protein